MHFCSRNLGSDFCTSLAQQKFWGAFEAPSVQYFCMAANLVAAKVQDNVGKAVFKTDLIAIGSKAYIQNVQRLEGDLAIAMAILTVKADKLPEHGMVLKNAVFEFGIAAVLNFLNHKNSSEAVHAQLCTKFATAVKGAKSK